MGATIDVGLLLFFTVLSKDPPGTPVPLVLQRCITVLSEKAVREDGIFRAVPPQSELAELRQKMVRAVYCFSSLVLISEQEEALGGDIDLSRYSVHVIAAALKAFLKDSPEPLLGWQDAQLANAPGTSHIATIFKCLLLGADTYFPSRHCRGETHSANQDVAKRESCVPSRARTPTAYDLA